MTHDEPPSSTEVPHPTQWPLHRLRGPAQRLIRRRYDVRLHQTERIPAEGPVIFAANHLGVLDGPLLAIFGPRPVHALTKIEMFEGRVGRFLRFAGQIPLERYAVDPYAIRMSLRVLRDGNAVGVFPEGTRGDGELRRFHHGAAYLALVSGAPVVPVTFFGTREPGGGINSTPARGSRLDLVYGTPVTIDARPWPRTRGMVRETSALLLERTRATLTEAIALTGRSLPGPLPPGEIEDDPDTGFVDEGAR
ncbi:lysophospholipid acyltransferase family protein [Nocardioides coralli]|uniref:lysophospholipid acyltransferase family protein n=1 Tax=Nocardioides coralli TaxID=2872154 RepID=UPI001CA42819|nr:lysophospholipid acyltransferase family protein [Nocardioides coralli]QZY30591.1 1-acyl-sn-glycerol-3-phosphate acyltransferase [Nocardioides coralli]